MLFVISKTSKCIDQFREIASELSLLSGYSREDRNSRWLESYPVNRAVFHFWISDVIPSTIEIRKLGGVLIGPDGFSFTISNPTFNSKIHPDIIINRTFDSGKDLSIFLCNSLRYLRIKFGNCLRSLIWDKCSHFCGSEGETVLYSWINRQPKIIYGNVDVGICCFIIDQKVKIPIFSNGDDLIGRYNRMGENKFIINRKKTFVSKFRPSRSQSQMARLTIDVAFEFTLFLDLVGAVLYSIGVIDMIDYDNKLERQISIIHSLQQVDNDLVYSTKCYTVSYVNDFSNYSDKDSFAFVVPLICSKKEDRYSCFKLSILDSSYCKTVIDFFGSSLVDDDQVSWLDYWSCMDITYRSYNYYSLLGLGIIHTDCIEMERSKRNSYAGLSK